MIIIRVSRLIRHDFPIYSCENPGCNAQFVAQTDSVSPLTFHFVASWTGNIDSW